MPSLLVAVFVQVFDTNGTYLRDFDGLVLGKNQLQQPYAVSCDSALNWVVADHGNDRIVFFTREGAFITAFGYRGQLYSPTGVCVDRENRIWVGDALGVQMYVFPSR